MPSFVVHLGPHKTGTTYIQARLAQNAARFQAQGIHVPLEWADSPTNPSHTGLAKRLNAGGLPELEASLRNFRNSPCHCMVMSSEAVLEKSDDALSLLRTLLGDDPFTIVYYVRRWSELLYSAWHEATVHGGTRTLLENAVQVLRRPDRSHLVNLDLQMARMVRAFGASTIKLVSYNEVLANQKDIFNHFANHFLGAPAALPPAEARTNESFTPAEAELVRVINHLHQQAGHPPSITMAQRWRRRHRDLGADSLLDHIDSFGKTLDLTDNDETIRPILERNWADHGHLALRPAGPKRFYRNAATQLRYFPAEYALAPHFAERVRALREALLR